MKINYFSINIYNISHNIKRKTTNCIIYIIEDVILLGYQR